MSSLKDLARECGVSVATVSKALNGQSDISAATRDRVREAARRMGYVPNMAARAMKTNRTYNLGVLFVDERQSGLAHEYFSAVLDAAGMTEDTIQKMYDYDRQQFNSERTFVERTQEFTAPAYESSEEEASPLMLRYQEAITTKDTYHETKSKFVWIGEIEDEHLLSALEKLSDEDLELLTLYIYEGYSTVELSKAYGIAHQNISKRIIKITNFLKNF